MTDLAEDDYVYTDLGVEKVHYCEVNGEKEMATPKGFILGDVPDFKQWNWIKLDNIRVNMGNSKLKQQLAIAVEALDKVATYMTCDEVEIREIQPNFCADQAALDTVNEAMDKIRELC